MVAQTENCPSARTLVDFGLGILDPQSAETICQHLNVCIACGDRAEDVPPDRFIGLLREAHGRGIAVASSAANASAVAADSIAEATIPPALAASHDYEIVRALGRGGMGVVYLARNLVLDRLEVLKVVSKSLLDRPGVVDRFQREIRAAARLSHPNVVAVYSAPRFGDHIALAMEYIDGENLAQIVAESGPLPIDQAVCLAYQAAVGLQHAHERGMVHRDIKPGNLMLAQIDQSPVVKILDFGLAKVTSEAAPLDGELTQSGQILGTPAYIAPEQTLDAAHADIRADIYSLGCTLYYLLAGHPPFKASSAFEIMHAHHHIEARPLDSLCAGVPVELAAVVARMMAKNPAARYQTPGEVARALTSFFDPHAKSQVGVKSVTDSGILLPGRLSKLRFPARKKLALLLTLFIAGAAALALVPLKSKTPGTIDDQADASPPKILVPKKASAASKKVTSVSEKASLVPSKAIPVPEKGSPPLAIAPFNASQARAYQEAWARHLHVPVEQTNSIGMKLMLLPPGEFQMGSTHDQAKAILKDAKDSKLGIDERAGIFITTPQQRVIISQPLLFGATEVTYGQFRQCLKAGGLRFAGNRNRKSGDGQAGSEGRWPTSDDFYVSHPDYKTTDDYPVVYVSWLDMIDFCNWLSSQENRTHAYIKEPDGRWVRSSGNGYRLPTEAEWEYACRAGSTTIYNFGDDSSLMEQFAWVRDNSGGCPHPVGLKLSNAFGLFDMYGNVYERCDDWVGDNWHEHPPTRAPKGPTHNTDYVHRGGECICVPAQCASAVCNHNFQHRNTHCGIRIVAPVIEISAAAVSKSATDAPGGSGLTPLPHSKSN